MSTQWILETHGDPLGAFREFVQTVWQQAELDKFLVPLNGSHAKMVKATILDDPTALQAVNPFQPLMIENTAKRIPDFLQENPTEKLGVMLRPCEMKALGEMKKRDTFHVNGLLTVAVDCLGTFPEEEYEWRAERRGTGQNLTQEALQFARQGGIVPYRYRSACQFCDTPDAQGADINIGVLGLPIRQHLVIEVKNKTLAEKLKPQNGRPDPTILAQRSRTIGKVVARHQRARAHVMDSLSHILPTTTDEIVAMLENCGSCQECMDVCPICAVDYPNRDENGRYRQEDVARWLVSCAGCGMCEQACHNHMPLSAIFSQIREQLVEAIG